MLENWWKSPKAQRKLFGIPCGVFIIAIISLLAGVIGWGGFNTAMEATNTLGFCISCHEMEDTVYQEYKQTIHYENRTGVRATCPDCHVPRPWIYKMIRKIQATRELYHKAMGTIDTPEKFEEHRFEMAKRVWTAMKETDSRECRNCHNFNSMDPTKQKRRAAKQHASAQEDGLTCIDCHKGIAHKPVHHLLEEENDEEETSETTPTQMEEEEPVVSTVAEGIPAETAPAETTIAADPVAPAPAAGSGEVVWETVTPKDITLFYPGQASLEWVLKGSDHGGARVFKKGEPCSECHLGEEADMGARIVTGEKVESTPIPGKRPAIQAKIQTAHTAGKLHIRMQWDDAGHTPVPFVDGGKMDPDNQIKVAMMITGTGLDMSETAGCWATCHHDSRYMPDAPDEAAIGAAGEVTSRINVLSEGGVTKYIPETRGKLEIKGRDGKPRGAWDKLNSADENAALFAAGSYMDLIRYNSGSDTAENGYILDQRVMGKGMPIEAHGELKDGVWTITFSRDLAGNSDGDIAIEPGKLYTVGFAIHDDYTDARFHHVTLDYKLGLDNPEAALNVELR